MRKMPPRMFVLLEATFVDAFVRVARGIGFSSEEADDCLTQIPDAVAGEDAWYDKVSNLWRYCFGKEMTINGAPGYGPGTWPQMEWAVSAARVMLRHMTAEDRRRFHRQAFGLPLKHADALAECRPLFGLSSGARASYEVDGANGKRIDWTIASDEGTRVLLEVKRRAKPMVEFLKTVVRGSGRPFTFDTDTLFKDTEIKFPIASDEEALQGLWIENGLLLDNQDVLASFGKLDPSRVQFAIVGGTSREVAVFCRARTPVSTLEAVLGVRAREVYRA